MTTRDKLRQLKRAARKFDFEPNTQLVHSLLDHGMDALDAQKAYLGRVQAEYDGIEAIEARGAADA